MNKYTVSPTIMNKPTINLLKSVFKERSWAVISSHGFRNRKFDYSLYAVFLKI